MNKIIVLILVLVLSLVFSRPTRISAQAVPSLYFDPTSLVLNQNETKTLELYFDSGNVEIVGVDLILIYDANMLEITSINDLNIFDHKISQIDQGGKLKLAFSNDFGNYVVGKTKFVSIKVKAKKQITDSKIYFDFTKGKSQDTNLVSKDAKDVLENVGEVNITPISTGKKNETSITPTTNPKPKNQTLGTAVSPTTTPTQTHLAKANDDILGASTSTNDNLPKKISKFPISWILIILSFVLLGVGSFILGKYASKVKEKV